MSSTIDVDEETIANDISRAMKSEDEINQNFWHTRAIALCLFSILKELRQMNAFLEELKEGLVEKK